MDIHTLAVVTCLSALVMGLGMGAFYAASPQDRCLRDWSMAGLLFVWNSVTAFLFSQAKAGPVLIALANASVLAGHVFILSGFRRHVGLPPLTGLALFVGAGMLGLHALPALQGSVESRWLVVLPIHAAINLFGVWIIWRSPGFRWRSPATLLLALEAIYVLQLGTRFAAVTASPGSTLQLLGSDFVQTSGRLALFLFTLLASTACALLVIRSKALALQQLAEIDPMTGWFNRRSMSRRLAAEFDRARRTAAGFHLLIFDIDHFKSINDRHGHAVGDQAIQHVTSVVARELRGYDERFRIGGEEFAVCVPGAQAQSLAERLRARVADSPLLTERGPLAITVSVGYSGSEAADADWEAVLNRADQALYRAKRGGRNRIEGPAATPSDLVLA